MRTSRNAAMIENVYRIKFSPTSGRRPKIESVNRDYIERRLGEVQRTIDPRATMLTIPMQGR